MAAEKKDTRLTYKAKNGKVYRFKEKHLKTRFRFPGNSKAYTADAITDPYCMERLIKTNSPKLEVVPTKTEVKKAETEKTSADTSKK